MARFKEISRNSGVDSLRPGSEWIMVPQGKSNIVCLTGGAGYNVKAVEGGAYVKITEIPEDKRAMEIGLINALFIGKDDKLLKITGLHRGPGKITASKGSDKAELKFSVHGSRTFSISFFFLHNLDAKKHPASRTSYGPKDAVVWVEKLNAVFGPQANIWFELGKNIPLAVSKLGDVVTSDHVQLLVDHQDAQVAPGKTTESKSPIRVFIVGPDLRSIDKSHPNGFYHVATKVILLKDQNEPNPWSGGYTSLMLKTLAHEIAHFLNYLRGHGEGHDYFVETGYKSDILNTMDGTDIKISRQRILDWNPT